MILNHLSPYRNLTYLQPDNILIGQDGRYKIGDLGLMNGRNRADSQKEYREGTSTYF